MNDISLIDAMILWNPRHENEPIENNDGRVCVVKWPDRPNNQDKLGLIYSNGACFSCWREASDFQRLTKLFIEAWHMVCRDGVHPKAIHEALMVIPEYRAALSGDEFFASN